MTRVPVSIVVVSRDRPRLLCRCLLGISQLQYTPFEIIVVADSRGVEAVSDLPLSKTIKVVPFENANISAARNLGINHSAGKVVAFIDDDAVPEPSWLSFLMEPALRSDVAAMGGYVRGRNGISWQWRARKLDTMGVAHHILPVPEQTIVLQPKNGEAVKTEGTNMAVRRDVLVELGGFDPAFRYFLDETDLNMRLAQTGKATVLVPKAEVHHAFALNAVRREDRVPNDLHDIGASWAVFQRKHVAQDLRTSHWRDIERHERNRLIRYLVSGGLEPRSVRRLLDSLKTGYAAGLSREIGGHSVTEFPLSRFLEFPSTQRTSRLILANPLTAKRCVGEAEARVKKDEIVTVLSLSPSALYHRVWFSENGVWMQQGGQYGRADRNEPLFSWHSRSSRLQKEQQRVTDQRIIRPS